VSCTCPRCGHANQASQKFCGECGQRLARAAVAERRRITVMVCDLVQHTTLAERLDPEDLRSAMKSYRETCERVVRRLDGTVAQWAGDGMLVYFGYPLAHEDDALRAVLAGLELLREAGASANPIFVREGFALRLRIGIHTGPVVVGAMGAGQDLAVGETPNLAARIQSEAEPNQVLISDDTRRQVEGRFDLVELGARSVKGGSRSVRLFQVTAPSGATSRMDVAAQTGFTPFVGRGQQLERLRRAWTRARQAQAQAVCVSGSAGLGKSRLMQTFFGELAAPAEIVKIQCSPLHRHSALHPLVTALTALSGLERASNAAQRLKCLRDLVSDGPPESLALFAQLLSVDGMEVDAAASLTPQGRRRRTLEALCAWILARARVAPTLIFIEDLHWADPTTLDLVGLLGEAIAQREQASLLLVTTFRPEELRYEWPRAEAISQCVLERLSEDETASMARAVVHEDDELPRHVIAEIVARTGGVPLFVEELTRFFLESPQLSERLESLALARELLSNEIPPTLSGLLTARLDGLNSAERELAQLAAVIGRSFPRALLGSVSGRSQQALDDSLKRLVEAQLLTASAADDVFTFRHALLQQAAYDTLLKAKRQEHHRLIAQILERDFADRARAEPELLARHFSAAGPEFVKTALAYWRQAAERALAASNNVEAIAHLSQALALAASGEPGMDSDLTELRFQLALAPAQMAILGWPSPEVERTCTRAQTLCQTLLAAPLEPEIALEVGQSLAGSLWGLWTVQFLRGNMARARQYAEQVLAIAQASGSSLLLVMGHHAAGFTAYYAGQFELAVSHMQGGLAAFDIAAERQIVRSFQFSSTVALLSFGASSLWFLGREKEARAQLARARQLVLRDLAGHPPSLAYLEAFSAYHWMLRREMSELARASAELRRLSEQEGFQLWLCYADAFDGIVQAHTPGQLGRGLTQLRHGMRGFRDVGAHLNIPELTAWEAELCLRAAQPDEALRVLERDLAATAEREEHIFLAEQQRLRAEALLALVSKGAPQALTRARSALEEALRVAREQKAIALEQRTQITAARVSEVERSPRGRLTFS
jgi:predicted ATPase/class 3 adenylate cyclase